MGQCNFSIAPVIYHFLILYISFANLKNFGFLRLHLYSRNQINVNVGSYHNILGEGGSQ